MRIGVSRQTRDGANALTYCFAQCGLSYVECCLLSGLQRYREASLVAAQALKLDPFNLELKKAAEEATRGILKDLLSGDATLLISFCHGHTIAPHEALLRHVNVIQHVAYALTTWHALDNTLKPVRRYYMHDPGNAANYMFALGRFARLLGYEPGSITKHNTAHHPYQQ